MTINLETAKCDAFLFTSLGGDGSKFLYYFGKVPRVFFLSDRTDCLISISPLNNSQESLDNGNWIVHTEIELDEECVKYLDSVIEPTVLGGQYHENPDPKIIKKLGLY
jgi:hypothetical protein